MIYDKADKAFNTSKKEEEGRLTGEFPGVEEARETHGPKIWWGKEARGSAGVRYIEAEFDR